MSCVSTCTRVGASSTASFSPSPLARWSQVVVVIVAARYARISQAQLLGLVQHALIYVITLVSSPELGQHIVPRLVFVPVRLFLFIGLASFRIGFYEDVEEGGDGRIGLCGAHRGAA